MLRPALAVALPAFGLALFLSQTDPAQRAGFMDVLRGRLGLMPTYAAASTQPASVSVTHSVEPTPQLGPDTFAIDADRGGQFVTTMLVRGRELPVVIDTGATYVALTFEDAASIGIHPANKDFKIITQTANGTARYAPAIISEIRVGNVQARNVPAFVSSPGALTGQNLLGMSFLQKLSGFEVRSGRLVLRQ